MRDPYEVLGVAKNASAKDIKAAYRKLAKKHHPDQNPNDPKAKDRFAAANQAYEIVGDEKNRQALRPWRDRRRRQAALPGFRGRRPRRRSLRRLPPPAGGSGRPALRVPRRRRSVWRRRPRRHLQQICSASVQAPPALAPAPTGQDVNATLDITVEEAATAPKVTAHVPGRPQALRQAAGLCRGRPDDPPERAGRAWPRRAQAMRWSRSGCAAIRATASKAATCMSTCRFR